VHRVIEIGAIPRLHRIPLSPLTMKLDRRTLRVHRIAPPRFSFQFLVIIPLAMLIIREHPARAIRFGLVAIQRNMAKKYRQQSNRSLFSSVLASRLPCEIIPLSALSALSVPSPFVSIVSIGAICLRHEDNIPPVL